MTPLVEVFSLREDTTVEEALRLLSAERYTHLPVYQRRAYNIGGVVHFFDLLFARDMKIPLSQLMTMPLYVSELMGIKELFLLFRSERKGFAVVVDEFGGACGIITLEDILEEVVGEIHDEYDVVEKFWKPVSPSQSLFDGRALIDEINETFHWQLPKYQYDTLAGFLIDHFGKIPEAGEILHYGQLTFLIKKATPRTVEEVLVEIEEKT